MTEDVPVSETGLPMRQGKGDKERKHKDEMETLKKVAGQPLKPEPDLAKKKSTSVPPLMTKKQQQEHEAAIAKKGLKQIKTPPFITEDKGKAVSPPLDVKKKSGFIK